MEGKARISGTGTCDLFMQNLQANRRILKSVPERAVLNGTAHKSRKHIVTVVDPLICKGRSLRGIKY